MSKENQSWAVIKAIKQMLLMDCCNRGKGASVWNWAYLQIQQGRVEIYSQAGEFGSVDGKLLRGTIKNRDSC